MQLISFSDYCSYMDYVSEEERFAFHLLNLANDYAKKEGLIGTSQKIDRLISEKEAGKAYQEKDYAHIVEFYILEFQERLPDSGQGVAYIANLIIDQAPDLANGTRTWDIQKGEWGPDEFRDIMATAELISARARNSQDNGVKILLIGLSLIIQYERFTSFAKGMIESLVLPEEMKLQLKKQRNTKRLNELRTQIHRIQEEVLCMSGQLDDNRSDVCHIRNAFAHAHFKFVDDQTIHLWDVSNGKVTYESTFNAEDLRHLADSFNQKLASIQVFAYFLVANWMLRHRVGGTALSPEHLGGTKS